MKKRSLNPRDSVYNAIRTRPADILVKRFILASVLAGIRSRIGIRATINKLLDAPGGST